MIGLEANGSARRRSPERTRIIGEAVQRSQVGGKRLGAARRLQFRVHSPDSRVQIGSSPLRPAAETNPERFRGAPPGTKTVAALPPTLKLRRAKEALSHSGDSRAAFVISRT